MSDPDLNLLVALDALLSQASVVGAAHRLGLSASAMSRTLARLRAATGDPLLVRAGRRLVLTPHAEALRLRTQNAVQESRSVLLPSTAEPDFSSLQRSFTIRANDDFVAAFGARLITAATLAAPLVRLCFKAKLDKTSDYLRDGVADLEIGVLSGMGPEVRIQALFRDHFVGAVRTGHPLATGRRVTARQYTAFGHVVASRHGRTDGPVDEALASLRLKRNVVAVVSSFNAALAVTRTSDLIALVPASSIGHRHADAATPVNYDLFSFELPVKTAQITVSQMWHPRFEVDPVHRWFRQLTLAVCRQADGQVDA